MSRPLFPFIFTLALFGVCFAGASRAAEDAVKIPDTPAGKQLAAWLEAYNSGDKQTQRKFIASHYAAAALKKDPVERRLGGFQMVYYDNRKLIMAKIERSTDHEIEALLQSPLTESWLRISLKVGKDAP